MSSVSPYMVATVLRRGLAVSMTTNMTALEQPQSVYILRPKAFFSSGQCLAGRGGLRRGLPTKKIELSLPRPLRQGIFFKPCQTLPRNMAWGLMGRVYVLAGRTGVSLGKL